MLPARVLNLLPGNHRPHAGLSEPARPVFQRGTHTLTHAHTHSHTYSHTLTHTGAGGVGVSGLHGDLCLLGRPQFAQEQRASGTEFLPFRLMPDGCGSCLNASPLGATASPFEQQGRGSLLPAPSPEFTGTTEDLGSDIWDVSGLERGRRALCRQREVKVRADEIR